MQLLSDVNGLSTVKSSVIDMKSKQEMLETKKLVSEQVKDLNVGKKPKCKRSDATGKELKCAKNCGNSKALSCTKFSTDTNEPKQVNERENKNKSRPTRSNAVGAALVRTGLLVNINTLKCTESNTSGSASDCEAPLDIRDGSE